MFWKRKRRKETTSQDSKNLGPSPSILAMRAVIAEQSLKDPLICAKMTAKDLTSNAMKIVKDERGVRLETIAGVLGSLAGYSTAWAMFHDLAEKKIRPEVPEVCIIQTKNSQQKFYFGDYLNRKLVEGEDYGGQKLSLWRLVAGTAQAQGGKPSRDELSAMFEHVAAAVGSDDFDKIKVPKKHHPGDSPSNFVKHLFPKFLPILKSYELPVGQYHLAFAMSIQEVMEMAKGVSSISPDMITSIVMQCAIPASKLCPDQFQSAFETP